MADQENVIGDISKEELETEIAKILENANLAETSTKKVIQALEKVFDCNLKDKKKIIDQLVMDYVNSKSEDEDAAEKSESEEEEEEEEEEKKPPPKRKRGKKKGSDDSDDDWGKKEAPPKKAAKTGRKGGGYTRAYKLSPQLAELMGKEEMPRHEVVKQVWAIIKEKNLYDPNNKQFAICDDALYKVIGTKRFRTFGMMKYLKNHFLDE